MAVTLADAFSTQSQSTAIIVPGNPAMSVSFQQLSVDVSLFQKRIAILGITLGSTVSIVLPNSYEFVVSFLAITSQRAIAAPLNPTYKQSEFEFYIGDLASDIILLPRSQSSQDSAAARAARKSRAGVAECFWDGKEVELLIRDMGSLTKGGPQIVAQPECEDVALVLHTSGTTGRPKAVPLTHRNLVRTMENIQSTYQLSPQDRTMLVMPLFHVHGLLAGLLAPLLSAGSVVVPPRFSVTQFWYDFITHEANWFTAVPTIHQILLKSPHPYPRPVIRFIRSCSSPLSPKLFHDVEEAFDAPVLEAYAMTEAAHQITSNPLPQNGLHKPGSVGVSQGVDVRILDQDGNAVAQGKEAEICIRGHNVTKGYINNPVANRSSFTNDGFFRTGDQGKLGPDGYLIVTSRIKEIINKGGEKISPIELDNVVVQHPAISEAVSFAIEDETYGQDIGIAVVLRKGSTLTANELKGWLEGRVTKFKLPKSISFTKIMPKTATGKVQRKAVADAMLAREAMKAKL